MTASSAPDVAARGRRLEGDSATGPVPALVWGEPAPGSPLVLAGHGGATGKDDPTFGRVCARIAAEVGAVVLAIDGPAHGERTPDLGDPAESFRAIRRTLRRPTLVADLTADWDAAIDALDASRSRPDGGLGFFGISMGTMLGMPVCAARGDVDAAVFALGGLPVVGGLGAMLAEVGVAAEAIAIAEEEDDAALRCQQVIDAAAGLGDTEVLMLQMADDRMFPLDGALELFRLLPGPKRLATWPGPHTGLGREGVDLAIGFLRRTLRPEPVADADGSLW